MAKSKKSTKTKAKAKVPVPATAKEPVVEETVLESVLPQPTSTMARLRTWNIWAAVLFGVQGLALVALAATRMWSVTTGYLAKDPIASQVADRTIWAPAVKHLFDVNLAVAVAVVLFLAAIAHLLLATKLRAQYEADIARRFNRLRWIEYGVVGGLMLAILGLVGGMSDLSSLFMLFVMGLVVAGLGLSVELHTGKTRLVLLWLCAAAGLVPWLVLGMYAYGAQTSGQLPGFVCGVYAIMFVLSLCYGVTLRKLVAARGRWADYLYGERTFIVLSIAAKAAFAWLLFAGALRP